MKKRIISLILFIVLAFSFVSVPCLAAKEEPEPSPTPPVMKVPRKVERGKKDKAPVIRAIPNVTFYVGEPVAYMSAISVTDDNDDPEDITVTVDKSKVKKDKEGYYPVVYTATDSAGNTATKEINLNFVRRSDDVPKDFDLDARIDEIIDEIITEDMTLEEKAFAVYEYCFENIHYTHITRTNKDYEAYTGFGRLAGDCYTFFLVSYTLLQRLDIPVIPASRADHESRHYWCIVDLGSGWYHLDSCNGDVHNKTIFMKTTDELKEIDAFFWKINPEEYPELAKKPYKIQSADIKAKVK